jgi:uncharacterized membrane protein
MDMLEGETRVSDYALERLAMLSDGVFAIAMTLLALDLRPPEHFIHTMPGLLDALSLPFMAFFWSFFSASSFWLTHRRLFGSYCRADMAISVINLLLLGEITIIPAVTRILTESDYSTGGLSLYLGLFGVIGLTNAISWLYAAAVLRVVRTNPGAGSIISVAIILAFIPIATTAAGVLGGTPDHHTLLLGIPLASAAAYGMRRLGSAFDHWRDRSHAATRPPAGKHAPGRSPASDGPHPHTRPG